MTSRLPMRASVSTSASHDHADDSLAAYAVGPTPRRRAGRALLDETALFYDEADDSVQDLRIELPSRLVNDRFEVDEEAEESDETLRSYRQEPSRTVELPSYEAGGPPLKRRKHSLQQFVTSTPRVHGQRIMLDPLPTPAPLLGRSQLSAKPRPSVAIKQPSKDDLFARQLRDKARTNCGVDLSACVEEAAPVRISRQSVRPKEISAILGPGRAEPTSRGGPITVELPAEGLTMPREFHFSSRPKRTRREQQPSQLVKRTASPAFAPSVSTRRQPEILVDPPRPLPRSSALSKPWVTSVLQSKTNAPAHPLVVREFKFSVPRSERPPSALSNVSMPPPPIVKPRTREPLVSKAFDFASDKRRRAAS